MSELWGNLAVYFERLGVLHKARPPWRDANLKLGSRLQRLIKQFIRFFSLSLSAKSSVARAVRVSHARLLFLQKLLGTGLARRHYE